MRYKSKYTEAFVVKMFEEQGCRLVGPFVDGMTEVNYLCSCGNPSKVKPYNFQNGSRCEKCRRTKAAVAKTLKHEDVKAYFENQGCELLEQYLRADKPLEYRCQCGNISQICFTNFKRGSRCIDCGRKAHSGSLHPKWNPDRAQVAMNKSIKGRMYNILHHTLDATGYKKNTSSRKLLGYGPQELLAHLKSHPDWERVHQKEWNIDHILPVIAFVRAGITDPAIINHLSNLRPSLAKVNKSKNDRYDEGEFEAWVAKFGWFKNEDGFIFVESKFIGTQVSFLIPTSKVKAADFHSYFESNGLSYTIETSEAHGFWKQTNVKDKCTKFVCSLLDSQIGGLVEFLSVMCSLIGEQAIYLTMGYHSWLVLPKEKHEIPNEIPGLQEGRHS